MLGFEHPADIHHRHAAAAAVLEELGVVHRAMMVDHIGRASILAQHDVRGIAEQRAVEAVRQHLGAADDGVRRVVVLRAERSFEVDGVDAWVTAPGREDERIIGERRVGGEKRKGTGEPRCSNDAFLHHTLP